MSTYNKEREKKQKQKKAIRQMAVWHKRVLFAIDAAKFTCAVYPQRLIK